MRLALRIARRSIRRDLARSLLIAVLVALPVAAATMVDVLARTMSAPERDAAGQQVAPPVRLPAHLATRELAYPALPSALVPESIVRERGWEREPIRTYVRRYDASATRDQLDAAVAAADRVGSYAAVEDGPDRSSHGMLAILAAVAGLVAVIGVAISVALSAAEGRADLATLAAVGAPPRRRRALAAAQALLVAGLGCALGVAFGAFVSFTARATTGAPGFAVPWENLALTLLVVPIVATAVGALLVPSRLPLMRRAT